MVMFWFFHGLIVITIGVIFALFNNLYLFKSTNFKITQGALNVLRELERVPDNVLKALEIIKNQTIIGKNEFLTLLYATIGVEQTDKYKSLILKHAFKSTGKLSYRELDPLSYYYHDSLYTEIKFKLEYLLLGNLFYPFMMGMGGFFSLVIVIAVVEIFLWFIIWIISKILSLFFPLVNNWFFNFFISPFWLEKIADKYFIDVLIGLILGSFFYFVLENHDKMELLRIEIREKSNELYELKWELWSPIIKILKESGEPLTPKQIADKITGDEDEVRKLLCQIYENYSFIIKEGEENYKIKDIE
jgi:hypothetical protein